MTENNSKPNPHPIYEDFEDFVNAYCHSFANLVAAKPDEVRNGMCDIEELQKSYDAGEMHGDVAWADFESSL